ncbi:MAG: hypothetical protein DI552_00240 [Brevundimonas sp.]|nr:MAG: hypothetical protein DI552_00240 [Brevundimonas sp.]
MRLIGEVAIDKISGMRAVGREGAREPRIEITYMTGGDMGVFVMPAREAALLRDYIVQGLQHLQK